MAARTELKIAPREVLGKKVKALRRQGFTPANIFGHHVESKAVQVPTDELAHTLKTLKRNEIVYLRLEVPLHFVGLAPAIDRHGGVLVTALDHISVEALPTEVPSFIEVDVSGLEEIDQSLHVSDLKIPEGTTVLSDLDLVIVKAAAPAIERAAAAEEAAEEAEKAEAAAAAAEAGEAAAEEASEE